MALIIAARFEIQDDAEKARRQLNQEAGISTEKMSVFYVTPQGQHAKHPVGGDQPASPGARDSAKGAVAGSGAGAVTGAAVGSVAGPVGTAVGAGVGAYTGSLAGAMEETTQASSAEEAEKEEQARFTDRHAGIHLAVDVGTADKSRIASVLRQLSGTEVEVAEGEIRDGTWVDFDPVAPVRLLN